MPFYRIRFMTELKWYVFLAIGTILLLQFSSSHAADEISDGSSGSSAANSFVYLPLFYDDYDCAVANGGPFGVQMYNNTSETSPYFGSLRCTGASWVRSDIDWERVEPVNTTPANYNWAHPDRSAGANRDAGLNVILTLEEAPEWASTFENGPIDKVGVEELAEFMKAVAERYDGDGIDDAEGIIVNHFELYNEPDAGTFAGGGNSHWGNDGDKYAAMLKAVYPAIKEANPNAKVLFGGIAYDWFNDWGLLPSEPTDNPGPFVRTFLSDVLTALGDNPGQYFDYMVFHQYPTFAPVWTDDGGPGLTQKTAAIREVLTSFGIGDKPIMITESGTYSDDRDGVTVDGDEVQSRYVVALHTQLMASGVDLLIWFALRDVGGNYQFENGLVTTDDTRKMSMNAYQTAVEMLGRASFVRTLSDGETGASNIEAHRFNDADDRPLYVVWTNPVTEDNVSAFTVPGSNVTVIDPHGNRNAISDGDDGSVDGQITILASGQPKYITVR